LILEKIGGSASSPQLNSAIQKEVECSERQAYRFIKEAVFDKTIFINKDGKRIQYSTSIYGL
jgi:hypothetical protein